MSDFVNFNKRGKGLPPGCKDLIDVLERRRTLSLERLLEFRKHAKVTLSGEARGSLSDLEDHVRSFFQSRSAIVSLVLYTTDGRLSVDLFKILTDEPRASVMLHRGSKEEQPVREFLSQRGVKLPHDAGLPKDFSPYPPVKVVWELSPIPANPAEVSQLLVELFYKAGLRDESPMNFFHHEISETA